MIKKLHISELVPGMYIDKVEAKWIETPFFNNPVGRDDIKKLKKHNIAYVYVDFAKSKIKKQEIIKITVPKEEPPKPPKQPERTFEAFKEEIKFAKEIKTEAFHIATETLEDVRMGKNINSEKIKGVVEGMVESMDRTPDALLSLARLKDFDNYTFMHSVNVAVLSMTLGKGLGFSGKKIFDLGMGGILHDIGKMKVPEEILNHPGKLSGEAWKMMQMHVVFSAQLLKDMDDISESAKALASQHHERLNGTGYPNKLKYFDIHEFGRIGSIADVYDAVTSRRVYKKEVFPAESMKILINGKGKDFQPNFVDIFIKEIGLYPIGSSVKLNSGEIALVLFNNRENPTKPIIQIILTATGKKVPHPVELDLAKADTAREIVCMVDPKEYGIDVEKYLSNE
jgi:HD-GYP domain-containing protein (c-di-GMP phosphodiesterase class II)